MCIILSVRNKLCGQRGLNSGSDVFVAAQVSMVLKSLLNHVTRLCLQDGNLRHFPLLFALSKQF